jgi:tetratricopeptide (TPR) repeat protein
VIDVDVQSLDRRPEPGVNPWDSVTSPGEVEGRIAMKVLGDLRRSSRALEAIEKPHYGPLWWLGAAAVVGLMVLAAFAFYRTKSAAGGADVMSGPEVVDSVTEARVGRSELRDRMFAAFRDGNYSSAVELGGRLESGYPLYGEEEFVLAEAARLNRHYDDAVRRYTEFIRRHPNNVRIDDAQFWMAETMRLQGNLDGARRYYRAVIDNQRSNVRDLAEKRLAQID